MHSVLFWTLSDPAQQSTAVHGPFTPAVFSVILPLLLSDHGISRAGQDANLALLVYNYNCHGYVFFRNFGNLGTCSKISEILGSLLKFSEDLGRI